jgi:hypothetical protein
MDPAKPGASATFVWPRHVFVFQYFGSPNALGKDQFLLNKTGLHSTQMKEMKRGSCQKHIIISGTQYVGCLTCLQHSHKVEIILHQNTTTTTTTNMKM